MMKHFFRQCYSISVINSKNLAKVFISIPFQKLYRWISFKKFRHPFFKALFNVLYADNGNCVKRAHIFALFHFHFIKTKSLKLVLMLVSFLFFSFQVKLCISHSNYYFKHCWKLWWPWLFRCPCWQLCHLVMGSLQTLAWSNWRKKRSVEPLYTVIFRFKWTSRNVQLIKTFFSFESKSKIEIKNERMSTKLELHSFQSSNS